MKTLTVLAEERIASIRDIQKNPSRVLRGVTRVTRGSKTIGFFLSSEDFADLVESQEALSSKLFLNRVTKARRQLAAGRGKSLRNFAKEYGI